METTIDTSSQTLPFQFHGKTGEHFRIWIVNVLLSILTLGIYSTWDSDGDQPRPAWTH